jgi:tRNA threonylcarbamoyladenosine biosynthesis protein TsaB
MNKLYIDTRDNKQIIVSLEAETGTFEEKSVANKNKAQATLPLIEKILKKAKLPIKDIEEINIEQGPGSFTGLRVGISIANALSFGGLIRINGKKPGEIELPKY